MDAKEDEELPLHDEAKARSDWRGGETFLAKGGDGAGLPASEVENGAIGEGEAGGSEEADGAGWAARRPPD